MIHTPRSPSVRKGHWRSGRCKNDFPEDQKAVTVMLNLYHLKCTRRDDQALDDEIAAYAKSQGLVIMGYHVDYGDDLVVRGTMRVIGRIETEEWADVAHRVALGNSLLDPGVARNKEEEFHKMHHHMRRASLLMSGRHLQHGDESQPSRNQEVFTNCSTAASPS